MWVIIEVPALNAITKINKTSNRKENLATTLLEFKKEDPGVIVEKDAAPLLYCDVRSLK
tara:strand:+ start:1713 stop:1889 length:177 start_codon:yes stop_codon:yes gene_type:complete